MTPPSQEKLRLLPGVDRMLKHERVLRLRETFGADLVKFALKKAIAKARSDVRQKDTAIDIQQIVRDTEETCRLISRPSLRAVINATGIVLHTNLGRAPLGKKIFEDMKEAVEGYSNLEFDLGTGARGHRSVHTADVLRYITGAEDVLVVNNNAAALVLVMNTLALNREIIVSRGELIEIGSSFRLPEILAASGCRMVEVGTTNRTRIEDYEQAITADTALLFKAHKSNYSIGGFTEEAHLEDLVALGKKKNLPVLYDIGSGLLRKPASFPLSSEPDVKSALALGVDLITFSGDKLLGGPQSGIIAGRKELVALMGCAPLMRAFRVGKLTIAALSSAARGYLKDAELVSSLPLFAMMNTTGGILRKKAEILQGYLSRNQVNSRIVASIGRCGGGTLPDLEIESFAVALEFPDKSQQKRSESAALMFHALLQGDRPILAVLRKGELVFDVLAMDEEDLEEVSLAVSRALSREGKA